MQAIQEDRRLHEAEIKEERRHCELESKEHMKGMHEQIKMLQHLVTDRGAATTHHSHSVQEGLRLTRLTEQDDIEAYLLTFKHMMEAYEIPQARWSFKLAPQ